MTALVDTDGTVLERYVYSPYGGISVLDTDFTTDADGLSDYANTTLYTGREFDTATGLFYYRARYYHAGLGRFVGRDPIGFVPAGVNAYGYVRHRPTSLVDPLGLRECYCDCAGLKPINEKLNGLIRNGLSSVLYTSPRRGRTVHQHVRDHFGGDVPGSGPAPQSWISLFVARWKDEPGGPFVNEGPSMKKTLGIVDTADCILVRCGGEDICIGTDKLDHFFQQGYMLYEITRAKSWEYAVAFAKWTEGLYVPGTDPTGIAIDNWLESGDFIFYGEEFEGMTSLAEFEGIWGGFVGAPASAADLAANLMGGAFFRSLGVYLEPSLGTPPLFEFDICNFVTEQWDHTR